MRNKTLKNLIRKLSLSYVNSNITDENFPDVGLFEPEKVELFRFDEAKKSEKIIVEMEKKNYRPATARELLAWADKGWKGKDIVVALGSQWCDSVGSLRVLCLWSHDGYRELILGYFTDRWGQLCRFAFIRSLSSLTPKPFDSSDLEKRVQNLENDMEKIRKFLII